MRLFLHASAKAPVRAHDSTHGREVHPEMLSDLRIAVLACIVRREDSAVAIQGAPSRCTPAMALAPSLRPRNVDIRSLLGELGLHLHHKTLVPQVDLPFQVFPGTLRLEPFGHEALR